MNQILFINKNNYLNENIKIKKNLFTIQLVISIVLIIITIIIYFFYLYTINKKETISSKLTNNYNISKLYNTENHSSINTYINNGIEYSVIGLIEIPKINLYYPILSDINDDLLKISPCKFYGPSPNELGNLCIAGHNYDNYKFFSKINSLINNDEIKIYDINRK